MDWQSFSMTLSDGNGENAGRRIRRVIGVVAPSGIRADLIAVIR